MFKSLLDLAGDVVTIAAAPVKITADVARLVTRPLADVARDTAEGVEELTKRDDEGRR